MNASPQQSTLTKLEQHLIHRLEEATTTLKTAHNEIESTRKELARLKAKLSDQPSLPAGFKVSPATQHALSTSKAQLSTAQKMLQQEIDAFTHQQLQAISHRATKAYKEAEYVKALNSSYAEATEAINARKADIAQNGVVVTVGLSGYQCKGDFDPQSNQLFTFESLNSYDVLEIQGQEYRISKSDISRINAGNSYQLQPVRYSAR